MIINFKVDNQKLVALDKVFLADKSQNLIECKFDFNGDDWEDKQRFALLKDNECNTYQLHIPANNTIKIPTDIVKQEKFIISLFGGDTFETRITTNMVTFRLAPSGYTADIKDLEGIDENIWVQIFDGIDSKSDLDHQHIVADIRDFPSLSEVALSGSYDDLNDKPYIPVKTSDLVNDGDGHNVFVKNNDARLSDTRNPKPHTHSKNEITDFPSKMPPIDHTHTKSEIIDLVLATVAVTGKYGDLKNKPSIPTKISDLTDDSNFVQKRSTQGFIKNDGSIAQTISVSEVIDEHSDDLENIGIGFSNAEQYQINRAIDITCYNLNNRLDDSISELSGKVNNVREYVDASLDHFYEQLNKKADITYVDNLIGEISEYVNR